MEVEILNRPDGAGRWVPARRRTRPRPPPSATPCSMRSACACAICRSRASASSPRWAEGAPHAARDPERRRGAGAGERARARSSRPRPAATSPAPSARSGPCATSCSRGAPADLLILTAGPDRGADARGPRAARLGRRHRRRAHGEWRCGAGDPAPSIGDAAALRAALLAADAIYFPDPKLATAGIHFAKVLDALGIAGEVAARLRPFPNGAAAMQALARAPDARPIGCTQVTEILNTPGVTLVGPLPKRVRARDRLHRRRLHPRRLARSGEAARGPARQRRRPCRSASRPASSQPHERRRGAQKNPQRSGVVQARMRLSTA